MSHPMELTTALLQPMRSHQQDFTGGLPKAMTEFARLGSEVLALPFDMAREQYAKSVRAGLVERSMIASARVEHAISALEQFTLGGMARRY